MKDRNARSIAGHGRRQTNVRNQWDNEKLR